MVRLEVRFKPVVVSKSLVNDPLMGKSVKIELAEEREVPPPVMISQGEGGELVRQVMPIVSQVMQILPFTRQGRASFPRLILWLTEDEWERLDPKPEVGEEVEVIVEGGVVKVRT